MSYGAWQALRGKREESVRDRDRAGICTLAHTDTLAIAWGEVLPTRPFHRGARGGGAQVLVGDVGLEQRSARSCWRPSSL